MAKLSFSDIDRYKGGASKFFKLEDGEQKTVRFLFNTIEDIEDALLAVHEYTGEKYATIQCGRQIDEPIDNCKWCAEGNRPVTRIVLPLFVEEDNEIQYWKKSGTWARDALVTSVSSIPAGFPISGQKFIIGRTGKDWKETRYSVTPDLRCMNDSKTKDQFGEIEDPFKLGMVKPVDFVFTESDKPQQSQQPQATRRTTDVF